MEPSFINRLVGTLILVVAAIVFIPNILDGKKVQYQESFEPIAQRPEFKSIDLQEKIDKSVNNTPLPSEPKTENITADDHQLAQSQTADKKAAQNSENTAAKQANAAQVSVAEANPQAQTNQTPTERSKNSQLNQHAFVIQLGSFSDPANVAQLVKKLKDNGFTTFTRPITTPNGDKLTKVFVGPELAQEPLKKQLPKLKTLTKLNGRITAFVITK